MKNDGWVRGYVKLQVCILDLGGVPKILETIFQIITENLLAKQWANNSQQIGNSQTINSAAYDWQTSRKTHSTKCWFIGGDQTVHCSCRKDTPKNTIPKWSSGIINISNHFTNQQGWKRNPAPQTSHPPKTLRLPVILLRVQKSCDHQLRLVVYPHYSQGSWHSSCGSCSGLVGFLGKILGLQIPCKAEGCLEA